MKGVLMGVLRGGRRGRGRRSDGKGCFFLVWFDFGCGCGCGLENKYSNFEPFLL